MCYNHHMKLNVSGRPRTPLSARINVDSDGMEFIATVSLPRGVAVFGHGPSMAAAVSDLLAVMQDTADTLRKRKNVLSDVMADELFVLDHVLSEGKP